MSEVTEVKHHKYGGSTIARVEVCPGSRNAIAALGERKAGAAADRGTRIHKHLEKFLTMPVEELTDLMFSLAMGGGALSAEEQIGLNAAEAVMKIVNDFGLQETQLNVEGETMLDHIHPEAGGFVDVAATVPFGDQFVIDLKTGKRFVNAVDCLQLVFYAVGELNKLDPFIRQTIQNVRMFIIQPEQGPPYECRVQQWCVSIEEFNTIWEPRIKRIIDMAEAAPEKRIPGDHCKDKYCDARDVCPAYQDWLASKSGGALPAIFNAEAPLAKADIRALIGDGEVLASQLSIVPNLKDLIKLIEERAKELLTADPKAIPGYGLEDSLGNRKWGDLAAAEKALKKLKLKIDDYKPRTFISPAQAEKALKVKKLPDELADLTDREVTGKKLCTVEIVEDDNDFAALFAQTINCDPNAAA